MEIDVIKLLICSLATWRISHMLVWESGPFDILDRVRELWLPINFNRNTLKYTMFKLFSCVYCMSVWVSIGITALVFGVNTWLDVATILAVSSLAIFYEELINGTR